MNNAAQTHANTQTPKLTEKRITTKFTPQKRSAEGH